MLSCGALPDDALGFVLNAYGIRLACVPPEGPIPGSYWGEPEAGVVGRSLYVRCDTPVHSALHEACHIVCMSPERRQSLDTDAGGGYEEENGVCYLQIILADYVPRLGRKRMLGDMDAWGYSFRLGSAEAWFRHDADDARVWLCRWGLLDEENRPTWRVRGRVPAHSAEITGGPPR